MSMRELKNLLRLNKEQLNFKIGKLGSNLHDCKYFISQEDYYKCYYPAKEIDKDIEEYKQEIKKIKHELQKLQFAKKLRILF